MPEFQKPFRMGDVNELFDNIRSAVEDKVDEDDIEDLLSECSAFKSHKLTRASTLDGFAAQTWFVEVPKFSRKTKPK